MGNLLGNAVQDSLGVFKADRHACQTQCVEMIGEALEALAKARQNAIDKASLETVQSQVAELKSEEKGADQKTILSILAVGRQSGFDSTLLSMLPDSLRKPKGDRSTFDTMAMDHLDAEVSKFSPKGGRNSARARCNAVRAARLEDDSQLPPVVRNLLGGCSTSCVLMTGQAAVV